jgi:signal peptidase
VRRKVHVVGIEANPHHGHRSRFGERMSVSGIRFLFRIASLLANVAVALALSTVILLFLLPRLLNWDLQVVTSGSMEPALPVGSMTFVEPTAADHVTVGDMLAYRLPAEPTKQVTHRVVEVVREGGSLSFVTKGDANDNPDSDIVPAENVIGKVRWDIPYLGYLAERLRTPQGFLVFVGIPGILIIAGEVWNIIRVVRRGESGQLSARPGRDP